MNKSANVAVIYGLRGLSQVVPPRNILEVTLISLGFIVRLDSNLSLIDALIRICENSSSNILAKFQLSNKEFVIFVIVLLVGASGHVGTSCLSGTFSRPRYSSEDYHSVEFLRYVNCFK